MNTPEQECPPKKLNILKATITLIAEKGYDGTTTARIAKRAGVGEGTIYRYFRNKSEIIDHAAEYVSTVTFRPIRENYDPNSEVHSQYIRFCCDFLSTGATNLVHYRFIEQYINSPAGIEYRLNILDELKINPGIKPHLYPLNRILNQAIEQNLLKDLPFEVLVGLTMGTLSFMLKHSGQGFFKLNKPLIAEIADSCWNAISGSERQKSNIEQRIKPE
ncbi:TetR/AcrR family transcriptional regulator [Desulfopila sp. IMCC35008]|uniref:TetR/AcrR family transcriptional regulator n=1 Tax=Desulfopila sp. IMCC35008 TaxID=2653858 RepID=UPI0013D80359|nr:TetR/AcrR family transcriptional regulator [Desulfopila sp. IMCC35008]